MKPRDQELQLLHDGELSEREARAAEERAAASPEDRARLTALREVGEVMRARLDLAAQEAAPGLDALWSRIERELEPARPARAARAEAPEARPGFLAWLVAARGYLATGALAAAAAAILVVALRPARVVTRYVDRPVQVLVPAPEPRPEVMAADAEVESLEVTGGTGTVFHIPRDADDDGPTTVIWVTRDDSAPEGPI